MAANEIFWFFQKHFFPFSGVLRGFSEKLMAEMDLLKDFQHIYSFRIFFQAVIYHFSAFSQNALTLVESHPMSLIGHNSVNFHRKKHFFFCFLLLFPWLFDYEIKKVNLCNPLWFITYINIKNVKTI